MDEAHSYIDGGQRRYASARRAALAAAELAVGEVDHETWHLVCEAEADADDSLAMMDDARLELRVAYLDMMAHNAKPQGLREVLTTDFPAAITAVCSRYGPRHPLVLRLRAARAHTVRRAELDLTAADKAAQRVVKAVQKSGLDADRTIKAQLKQINVLHHVPLPEEAARVVLMLLDVLPAGDPRRNLLARAGCEVCTELGEIEAAWQCFQVHYARECAQLDAQVARCTGEEQRLVRTERVSLDCLRGKYLVEIGEPAEAEDALLAALDTIESLIGELTGELTGRRRANGDLRQLHDLRCITHARLGDAFVARGQWPDAYESYLRAFRSVRMGSRQVGELVSHPLLINAIHAEGTWRTT